MPSTNSWRRSRSRPSLRRALPPSDDRQTTPSALLDTSEASLVDPGGSANAPQEVVGAPAGPCTMVIFGGGGDLTKRLLVPALYNLSHTGLLPEHFAIVGVDAVDQDVAAWTKSLHDMLQSFVGNASSESRIDAVDDTAWKRLADSMSYLHGDFNDPDL